MSRKHPGRFAQSGEARPATIALLIGILAVSWVLWSGIYKPVVLGLGAFSCVLTAYLAQRMGFFRHSAVLTVVPKLPRYWYWLLREIVSSSFEVARVILTPSLPISPTMVELKTEMRNEVGLVILGNSITLSPGTVTLDVHEGQLLVHCLTRESAQALDSGESDRRVVDLGLG
jgi:multicomponent Na+:H+ antiporter subunit E